MRRTKVLSNYVLVRTMHHYIHAALSSSSLTPDTLDSFFL